MYYNADDVASNAGYGAMTDCSHDDGLPLFVADCLATARENNNIFTTNTVNNNTAKNRLATP